MKAIVIHNFGGPEVLRLEEVQVLKPGPGEVLVEVKAVGVNPVETYQRAGSQGYDRPRPFTPGADAAGIVRALGDGLSGNHGKKGEGLKDGTGEDRGRVLKPGDRVYTAGSVSGTYAEFCLCRKGQVHPLPEGLSFEEGACLWVNYSTAYRALFQRGMARAGETALVHGGTGGVGVAAVQWALYRGIRVIASYGSEEGEKLLADIGVEYRVSHHDPSHGQAVAAAAGRKGVDLIIEMLADVNLEADLSMLAERGRIMVVGSRGKVEVTPRALMRREADIRGVMLYYSLEAEVREIHAAIEAAAKAGGIGPVIQRRLPLAQAAEAHRAVIEDPSHGKIVLIP